MLRTMKTEFKLKYVCNHRSIEIYIVWFFISFTPLFPIFASAHIFGRFLSLQFQFPLGNTSSVTFHLLNICREEKIEMREKSAKTMTALSCKYVKLTLLHYTNWLIFSMEDEIRNELDFRFLLNEEQDLTIS